MGTGGSVPWSGDKVQAVAKEGSQVGWGPDVGGEVVEGKVVWSIEVVPGGDLGKVYGGVVVGCLVRVGNKAIGFY